MDELVAAYLNTQIVLTTDAGDRWVTANVESNNSTGMAEGALGFLKLDVQRALVITAWNPLGQKCDPEENDALQKQLISDLKTLNLVWHKVVGQAPDGTWSEDSLLVPIEADESNFQRIVGLAKKYDQNAIFELTNSTKRIIGVCLPDIAGESAYRLLPMPGSDRPQA
jgi:hypothetical protein